MDEENPPIFMDVKNEFEDYHQMDEEKPPNLAPPPTIPRYSGPSIGNLIKTQPPLFSNDADRNIEVRESFGRYATVDRYNEDVTMRFLFGNGQPLSTVEDPHFQMFLHHLNPTRPVPEPQNMATTAMKERKPVLEYQRNVGPMNVTIEAIRKGDEVFLSISAHYYDSLGDRANTVHFEKIILADYEGRVVADRLRRVVDIKKTFNFSIANIISPNIRMAQLVAEHMHFNNRFICFYSYLSNIAREVINIPEFLKSLTVLREYVKALRQHPEVYTKFRMMKINAGCNSEVPNLDIETDWLTTLQFLSACGLLNEIFANLHENWCMPPYLDKSQENIMANLIDFLLVLCHVSSEICSEESCVSQVLYSMSVVNNAIENCGIVSVREKMRKIFNKYYTAIANGKVGDFYSISALLDPRYGYSNMIFNDEDWQNAELKVIKEVGPSRVLCDQMRMEVERYRTLLSKRPTFDEITTPCGWWNDLQDEMPLMYRKWIEYSGVPAVSIDGKRFFAKGGKLAHLFSTLDEEMHIKAALLAQSSQDFVGRGSASILVLNQIREGASTFKKLENEEEMQIKEENLDDSLSSTNSAPILTREIKEEDVS